MKYLNNKKILLVICGGIAAYKSLEIIRQLKKNDATVKTILTKSAEKFVTKLSIVSLSQNKVYNDLFDSENELEMDHISLSRWADLILVVPATANMISKISQGLADDLASTVIMASNKKVMLAPAMNVRMWENPSNKENLNKIIGFGYEVIGPEIGEMACGEFGEGKLTEPSAILNYLNNYFFNISKNKKLKALVTTGPTQENIDPVRYITNHSSGLQGYEIAKSLSENGFETTLISGPTNLKDLPNINIIKIKTAEEMFEKTVKNLPVDVAVFAAAVSDFTFVGQVKEKIKKKETLQLNLTKTKDILSYVSKHNSLRPKLVIGFSAETHNLDNNAIKKLKHKNCDWIIGNDVGKDDIGFGSEMNAINIYTKENKIEKISKNKKSIIAKKIVNKIVNVLN
tara:strand:- start:333 stop:1532 length:1200 start_codon:yes stop_codon:yes gene_type:complete